MPRNGSGTYTSSDTIANATTADAVELQAILNDMATALTGSLAANGETTITGQMLGLVSSNPAWSFVGDTNTGFGSDSADEAWIKAGGTETVTVVATGATVTGTAGVSGNFAVATNKFTVTAASGNTLVAGTLDVTGNTTMVGRLTIPDGTAASPAIRQTAGASDSGVYFIADDQLGFSLQGVLRVSMTTTALTTTGEINAATAAGSMIASQAEQETGSATDKLVTPGRQHFHPGAAKAWGVFAGATGTSTATYNCTTARVDTGDYTVTIGNDFSSANYVVLLSQFQSTDVPKALFVKTQAAGSFTIKCRQLDNLSDTDAELIYFACYGDL